MKNNNHIPKLGIGVGLRPVHYEEIFSQSPAIDWFEIISENYMIEGESLLKIYSASSKNIRWCSMGSVWQSAAQDPLIGTI